MPKSIAVDLARITYDDALLRDGERTLGTTAKHPDANTRYLLHTVPGSGTMLRRVLRYEMQDITRVPRGQDCVSSCRLGKWAQESAGKRLGTSGAKSGKAPLTGAFAEAAVLFLRAHPAAQTSRARLAHKHDTGHALTGLAQQLARAVYYLLQHQGAFAREKFFQR